MFALPLSKFGVKLLDGGPTRAICLSPHLVANVIRNLSPRSADPRGYIHKEIQRKEKRGRTDIHIHFRNQLREIFTH